MILATPFLPGLTDYDLYAKEIRRRGNLLNHTHVVISRAEDESDAFLFGEQMSDLFFRSHTSVLQDQARTGHQLSTDMLKAATKFAATYQTKEGELPDPAVIYMDPTYRPLDQGWLDLIQSTYYLKQAPLVFGRIANPDVATVLGPVVFSKDFYHKSGLLHFVPHNIHWREYLKHEISQFGVDTKLIGSSVETILRVARKNEAVKKK